jgi:amino acid transporter
MPPPEQPDFWQRTTAFLKRLIGPALNPFDPKIFHKLSLVAFLAWVGLGADGLSSACYGPQEAYKVLLDHNEKGLAILLAAVMAFTIWVISRSYMQIIEHFPSGGGGYVVASKLLGSGAGVASGCALVVDYVLTISISVAAAVAALYSPWPWMPGWERVLTGMLLIAALILLNLRGVKESVTLLTPIFLLFLVTHALLIGAAIGSNIQQVQPTLVENAQAVAGHGASWVGLFALAAVFLRAYSLGGSSFTGIEAVSNSVSVLREPRVETGKKTMRYMALSLSLAVAGLLIAYLLIDLKPVEGKTFNAILAERVMGAWQWGPFPIGRILVFGTLLSAAALLLVAAQTGFLGGPGVLASMAIDSWVPRRFQLLSERLVMKDGILLMGLASLGILYVTRGDVSLLAVMYSINVFITFTLSQLGMCRQGWSLRAVDPSWRKGLSWNVLGLAMTAGILVVTVCEKFPEGGWGTLCITGACVGFCIFTRRHYRSVEKLLKRLDQALVMPDLPLPEAPPQPDADKPTAVLLVSGFNGLGVHAFYSVQQMFPNYFGNFVFVSTGVLDASKFKGQAEVQNLERATEEGLARYVALCHRLGRPASYRFSVGTDVVGEVEGICQTLQKEFGRPVFFAARLVFQQENALTRMLHNHKVDAMQRRLSFNGMPMVVLPIRAMR